MATQTQTASGSGSNGSASGVEEDPKRGDPFIRATVWTLVITFALVLTAFLVLRLAPSEPRASDEAARRLAARLESDLSQQRQPESAILSRVDGQALGIEQIEDGVRLVVRIREDADSSGWPCFRLTIRRAGTGQERSSVERLPSCPVAVPLRPRIDQELADLQSRLTSALEALPGDVSSEAVVLGELIKADLPAPSVQAPAGADAPAFVAVGTQPRCVLGYVRPQGEDRPSGRVLVWPAPPDRPCSSATAAEFAGMY